MIAPSCLVVDDCLVGRPTKINPLPLRISSTQKKITICTNQVISIAAAEGKESLQNRLPKRTEDFGNMVASTIMQVHSV